MGVVAEEGFQCISCDVRGDDEREWADDDGGVLDEFWCEHGDAKRTCSLSTTTTSSSLSVTLSVEDDARMKHTAVRSEPVAEIIHSWFLTLTDGPLD